MATEALLFHRDSYELTVWNSDSHKWLRSMYVETEVERFNDETGEEWTERVVRLVIGCSICSNPAIPQYTRDTHPSVCSRECGRIEDELCDAANERYYAGP